MFKRVFLVCFFMLLVSTGSLCAAIDCSMARVIIPLAKDGDKVTCAASFKYGQYVDVKHTKSMDDFLDDDAVEIKTKNLKGNRQSIPELTVIDFYDNWRSGNFESAKKLISKQSKKIQNIDSSFSKKQNQDMLKSMTKTVFLDKIEFGEYVRISFMLREPPKDKNKKGKAFPLQIYLRYDTENDRYEIVDIPSTLFEEVASVFSSKMVLLREDLEDLKDIQLEGLASISLLPDSDSSTGFAICDATDEKKQLTIYADLFTLDKVKSDRLKSALDFYNHAVKIHHQGVQEPSEIVNLWSGESAKGIAYNLSYLKENGSTAPYTLDIITSQVKGLIPIDEGVILYYNNINICNGMGGVLIKENEGNHLLCHLNDIENSYRNVFRDKQFKNFVVSLLNGESI